MTWSILLRKLSKLFIPTAFLLITYFFNLILLLMPSVKPFIYGTSKELSISFCQSKKALKAVFKFRKYVA